MEITYKTGFVPKIEAIIDLYKSSGISRPVYDAQRIEKMYANSNLVITAWMEIY